MTGESSVFNLLSVEGYRCGDLTAYIKAGLPADTQLRFAYLAGLAAERIRIRNSTQAARYVYRGRTQEGAEFEIAFGSKEAPKVDGPMSAADIAALRNPAQREYERKLMARMKDGREGKTACINGVDVPLENPALDAVSDLEGYRRYKACRNAINIRKAFGNRATGPTQDMLEGSLKEFLEVQIQDLAMERMAEKMRLVNVLDRHGLTLFRNRPEVVQAAKCAILARTWLDNVFKSGDAQRKTSALGILGARTISFYRRSQSGTRAMRLLNDYDLFANRLCWRSGIAVLNAKAREDILKLCVNYEHADFKGVEGFGAELKGAAAHVRALIVSDLFSPETLKRAYAIA